MARKPRAYRSPFESRDAEIARLKAEIERITEQPLIRTFATELCENIGTMLAVVPYEQWPEMAKVAYRHASQRNQVGAWYYMERHRKANASRV